MTGKCQWKMLVVIKMPVMMDSGASVAKTSISGRGQWLVTMVTVHGRGQAVNVRGQGQSARQRSDGRCSVFSLDGKCSIFRLDVELF